MNLLKIKTEKDETKKEFIQVLVRMRYEVIFGNLMIENL